MPEYLCYSFVCDTYEHNVQVNTVSKIAVVSGHLSKRKKKWERERRKMKSVTIESTTCGRSGHCFLSRCVEQMIFREETMALRVRSIWFVESIKLTVTDTRQKFPFFLNVIIW